MSTPIDCAWFANATIRATEETPELKDSPLLRAALEFSTAWAFERLRRGALGEPKSVSAERFADECVDIATQLVVGRVDLIDNWDGHPAVRAAFRKAVVAMHAWLQKRWP